MGTDGSRRPSDTPPEGHPVAPDGAERRTFERIPAEWSVDYTSGDTFLYSYITNISAMGIFIFSRDPLPVGSTMNLRFAPPGEPAFDLIGEVAWINPFRPHGENINPGMGVRFVDLDPDMRERLVQLVTTIAYLPEDLG